MLSIATNQFASVIDHRWRQNVVRTSVIHSAAPRVPLFCSYHILTSSVIYYWTDARQHGIYLLNKTLRTFENTREIWKTLACSSCFLHSLRVLTCLGFFICLIWAVCGVPRWQPVFPAILLLNKPSISLRPTLQVKEHTSKDTSGTQLRSLRALSAPPCKYSC